jgi:ATP-dependent Clp protease adaptor protein ClpS
MPRTPSAASGGVEVLPDVAGSREDDVVTSIDEPYNVFLWNDPVTLMEVVVRVLGKVFGYDAERAEMLMLKAHHEGRVVVWTGERDRAVRYCLELGTNGLQSTVARAG